jgi:hypothetical protein
VVDLALKASLPVIHIAIDKPSGKVRLRGLVGSGVVAPLAGPVAFAGMLRSALRLGAVASIASG